MENRQRDFAKNFIRQKYNLANEDILIFIDIDEILTVERINFIRNNSPNNFKFIKSTYLFPYYYHKILNLNGVDITRYNKE